MKNLLLLTFIIISFTSYSQIKIDGRFEDWKGTTDSVSDVAGDGIAIDFLEAYASSDENYLYLRIKLTDTLNLQSNNTISLYLDTDNKASTGTQINLIGAELIWNFGFRNGTYSGSTIRHQDLEIIPAPTFTGTEFEIAINRKRFPIFSSDTIKIVFRENISGGDMIPTSGTVFSYVFNNKIHATPDIVLAKEDTGAIRVMNYNVLFDGLTDPSRESSFIRILQATNPQIIAFNELFNTSATTVKTFLDTHLPTGNSTGWFTEKLDAGNVTASIFPIQQNWQVLPGKRITASLIDLPAHYPKDLIVINSHLKCCDFDSVRQDEADAIAAFIKDIKKPGGAVDVPDQTPFIVLGDLNLVGDRQQLETIVTGEIVNKQLYGESEKPDWDNTDLVDLLSTHTDDYFTFTWKDDFSDFYPGRLDYMIYSESVLDVVKHYTLNTQSIPQAKLQANNIFAVDTKFASDHLPKVADFKFQAGVAVKNIPAINEVKVYPIPASDILHIEIAISKKVSEAHAEIFDLNGRLIKDFFFTGKASIDVSSLAAGTYILKVKTEETLSLTKIIKTK